LFSSGISRQFPSIRGNKKRRRDHYVKLQIAWGRTGLLCGYKGALTLVLGENRGQTQVLEARAELKTKNGRA